MEITNVEFKLYLEVTVDEVRYARGPMGWMEYDQDDDLWQPLCDEIAIQLDVVCSQQQAHPLDAVYRTFGIAQAVSGAFEDSFASPEWDKLYRKFWQLLKGD